MATAAAAPTGLLNQHVLMQCDAKVRTRERVRQGNDFLQLL
jgi:hypothetical protein